MDSVSWLLPGAHISQTEDGAGPLVSPQWSGLPAGTHCQCPSAAPLEPTVGAEKGWGPPSHGSWFRAFHQECLRSGREGTQREGPRGGAAPPSWCGLVSFTADRPEVPDLRGGGAQPPRSIGPLGPRCEMGPSPGGPLASPPSPSHRSAFTALVAFAVLKRIRRLFSLLGCKAQDCFVHHLIPREP